jgi:hypothetical protein
MITQSGWLPDLLKQHDLHFPQGASFSGDIHKIKFAKDTANFCLPIQLGPIKPKA